MITFLDLQNGVLRWLDEVSDVDQTRNLVKDALNRSHRRFCLGQKWPFSLWPNELTITTVQGRRTYATHPSLAKMLYLLDVNAHTYCSYIPRTQWQQTGIDRIQTNGIVPSGFDFGPVWPVAIQPTTETVTVTSTEGADTAVTVQLVGLDENGDQVTETVTATGMTPAASTTTFSHLLAVTKIGTWLGTMTLAGSTSAATLLRLTASQTGKQYPTIEFTENPQANLQYKYRFQRIPDALVNDNDLPNIFPNDAAEILVYDALYHLTTYNTELGLKEQAVWKPTREEFYNIILDANDGQMIGSSPRTVRDIYLGGDNVVGAY